MTPSEEPKPLTDVTYRRWLTGIFLAAVVVGMIGIGWGMPNGNRTWGADSVAPMTPLAVAYNVFVREGFDSGYFYFKYPVGHQLFLAAVASPVLAVAVVTGNLEKIENEYPFGFEDPEVYLSVTLLALRLVSAVMGAGLLLLIAGIARRLVSGPTARTAGVLAALAAAGSYPLVFYSHTSNVEVPYLFWAFLALYCGARALEQVEPRWYWGFGFAAAMAVSTKEQIVGFLVFIPVVLAGFHWTNRNSNDRSSAALLPAGALSGLGISLATFFVANAGFYNPSGMLNRIRFLTHTLDPEVRALYAPYEFPIDFSGGWGLADEILHLAKTGAAVGASIGWPAALLGVGGLAVMVARCGARGLLIFAPLVGYYVFSLRMLKQVEIRYTMALSCLLAVAAGISLAWLWRNQRPSRPVVAAMLLGGLIYSGEVVPMLTQDSRYAAERWMKTALTPGDTVEVYQSWTYLPRWQNNDFVHKPEFEAITVPALTERRPDFIVLSSKGREGMYMYPNPDWRDGRGMMLEAEANRRFLSALEDGELPYTLVAHFEREPMIPRLMITSLSPAISIYAWTADGQTPPS